VLGDSWSPEPTLAAGDYKEGREIGEEEREAGGGIAEKAAAVEGEVTRCEHGDRQVLTAGRQAPQRTTEAHLFPQARDSVGRGTRVRRGLRMNCQSSQGE
jgi:hypothetical protein